jgi:tRNA threonylcarbamoyladenosine biosynthesis protein TsaB
MPVILSLETSADVCSVALHDGRELLADAVLHEPQVHAAKLAPMIEEVMKKSGRLYQALQAVALSAGPGSYTGLRIGTSTAKGLCYALDIPLIAVGTLELMAHEARKVDRGCDLLCPMIDARRMEVYCLVMDSSMKIVEPVSAKIIDSQSFSELLGENRVLFFGSGAEKCRSVMQHPNASFADGIFPSAISLGEIAQQKFDARSFEDLAQFNPFYLKEFVAKTAKAI